MLRVLDIDLDFFMDEVAHWRGPDAGRLDPEDYPAWTLDAALDFLERRCRLKGRLPGFVVEHHGEIFGWWREAIAAGVLQAPFHVTHVDAHADLGLGDAGYAHLLTDLLWREPEDRQDPGDHLNDANYLAFALGCRWLSSLDYVFNRDDHDGAGPGDLMPYLFAGFEPGPDYIEIPALTARQLDDLLWSANPVPTRVEPRVPFRAIPWRQFTATEPFDVVCLARSPEYTPATCDPIFNAIRERFIDEISVDAHPMR